MKYSIPALFLTFLPVVLRAQGTTTVEHIISRDYLSLVRDTSTKQQQRRKDSVNIGQSALQMGDLVSAFINVGHIYRKNDLLYLLPKNADRITLMGDFTTSIVFKTVNRQPALQSQYAQGRAVNGALSWQGAETGEPFSYGPALSSLEFDGSAYPYDTHGRLVPAGSGNGSRALRYNNGIFRTGALFSQSFHLNGEYYANNKHKLGVDLKLGRSNENTVIKDNENNSKYLTSDLIVPLKRGNIKAKYSYLEDSYSNYNRNGFLNRLYQYSLLTPLSFDNAQGTVIGAAQRSYSNTADNPLFLLDNNGHYFKRRQHNAGITLNRPWDGGNVTLTQSLEKISERSDESYKPGTVGFPDGIGILRNKQDQTWNLRLQARQQTFDEGVWKGDLSANYIFTDARSAIRYAAPAAEYKYQRSLQELWLSHKVQHRNGSLDLELEAGNHFYVSNTVKQNTWWLPAVSGFIKINNFLDYGYLRLNASYDQFNSELPVNRSLGHVNLLRYTTAEASAFLPFPEVSGFDQLDAIRHREWSGGLSLGYRMFSLTAVAFIRDSKDDIFPVFNNGRLELQNVASHRNSGMELTFSGQNRYWRDRALRWSTQLSFLAYKDKVSGVREGYNFTPVAGFRNVHRALVQDASIGAIVGNSYRRDAAGNIVIGSDGFPLVDDVPKVIGDAVPDWVLKANQRLEWKNFTLNLDLEWKKGGDVWNGTQAALDYYGRSQNSALLRNTKGYVFEGVLEDGHVNNIPVDFYDPAAPFAQNRWLRYGPGGVAEAYIQRADHLRINMAQLGYRWSFDGFINRLVVSAYVNNILLWSAYDGADPNQLLYDQPNTSGLDYFNLPSVKAFGCNVSIQF